MAEQVVVFTMIAALSTVSTIQGAPQITFDKIIEAAQEAANNGKWNDLQNVLSNKYDQIKFQPDLDRVRLLKPVAGGHVYGESELTFHSSVDQGAGKKVEQSAGHRVVNNDGHVKELDFTPDKSEAMKVFLDAIAAGTKPPPYLKEWVNDDGHKHEFKSLFEHQVTPMVKAKPREGKATGAPASFEDIVQAINRQNNFTLSGDPVPFEDIVKTINGPLASKFHEMFKANFSGIRELKPLAGGHVYGKADLTVRSATAVNGKTVEESASGHRVINDDGHVSEFDIKPDETGLSKNLIELLLKMSGQLDDLSTRSQRTS